MSGEPTEACVLEHALAYVAYGFRVFPVAGIATSATGRRCRCGKVDCGSPGKHPRLRDWQQLATSEEGRLREWFGPEGPYRDDNLAVATGKPSGVFVLDVDPRHGGADALDALEATNSELPETLTAQTGGGGRHLFFKYPANREVGCKVGLAPGIDVRGDGGLVVVEPSRHISGGIYAWEDGVPGEVEIAEAPDWLLDSIQSNGSTRQPFALPESISEGERNHTLFRFASSLRAKGCEEPEILSALRSVNSTRCKPTLQEMELQRIVESVKRYPPGDARGQGTLPEIDVTIGDLRKLSDLAWAAIAIKNHPEHLFRYGGVPARVERDDSGAMVIRDLTNDRMRYELARSAQWHSWKKGDGDLQKRPVAPPMDVVRDVLARPEPPLPILHRVVAAPVAAPDGSIVTEPGYHRGARVFFDSRGLTFPTVSPSPSKAELNRAKALILADLLGDFPFCGPADLANTVAQLILPFIRDMIDGPTPLHLIEKPSPGTGASLLVEMISMIATGGPAGVLTEGNDEDEWRKRVTAALLSGAAILVVDNLRGQLDSASLAAAITADVWTDRLLGQSRTIRIPVRVVWVATGNNPSLSSELARRSVSIRLDAKQDRPWERTEEEFRHPNLRVWVREHRGELVWAVLTLIRAWVSAGRPREGSVRLGMFESWSETIGGVLRVVDIPGFLDNRRDFYDRADLEGEKWRDFIAAWWESFRGETVGTTRLFSLTSVVEAPCDLGRGGDQSQRVRLGNAIRSAVDRRFQIPCGEANSALEVRIVRAGTHRRAAQYQLGCESCESGESFAPRTGKSQIQDFSSIGGRKDSRDSPHSHVPEGQIRPGEQRVDDSIREPGGKG